MINKIAAYLHGEVSLALDSYKTGQSCDIAISDLIVPVAALVPAWFQQAVILRPT